MCRWCMLLHVRCTRFERERSHQSVRLDRVLRDLAATKPHRTSCVVCCAAESLRCARYTQKARSSDRLCGEAGDFLCDDLCGDASEMGPLSVSVSLSLSFFLRPVSLLAYASCESETCCCCCCSTLYDAVREGPRCSSTASSRPAGHTLRLLSMLYCGMLYVSQITASLQSQTSNKNAVFRR